MLRAKVYLLPVVREERKALKLTPLQQKRVRSEVLLSPTKGECIYPILSVKTRFRKSGIYRMYLELRDCLGIPILAQISYLYVDHTLPVFVFDLCKIWPSKSCSNLKRSDMEVAEIVAQRMVDSYGAPA